MISRDYLDKLSEFLCLEDMQLQNDLVAAQNAEIRGVSSAEPVSMVSGRVAELYRLRRALGYIFHDDLAKNGFSDWSV